MTGPVAARNHPIPVPPDLWSTADRFWGKFVAPDKWLPLPAHCLDVALVFRSLCDVGGIRRSLEGAAGGPISDQVLDRMAVIAVVHDAGKANWGFQRKVFDPAAPQAGHIRELAPLLDPYAADPELQRKFLKALPAGMETWFTNDTSAYSYLIATFSHHGRPLRFKGERSGPYQLAHSTWWRPIGDRDPFEAVELLSTWARKAYPHAFDDGPPLPDKPRFQHVYAGLLNLADWLGSFQDAFPVQQVDIAQRMWQDRGVIPRLLRQVGLDAALSRSALAPADFEMRFGFPPRPLQAFMDTVDLERPEARLVIAESETGSGKTEASLEWFARLFAAGKVDGLYFALPSRVAARGIYDRIVKTVERWYPNPQTRPLTVLAVPGYAQIDGALLDRILPSEASAGRSQDDSDLARSERQWAAERPKRFLAATVAVGTIDQALLSVVRTAHAHLRSACLDRSLLVVDEVHASDAYMSDLLGALLKHHMAVGGSAMLLSATLGARARTSFMSAVGVASGNPTFAEAVAAPYPSVTLLGCVSSALSREDAPGRSVHIELVPQAFHPERSLDRVVPVLCHGGRVLVILNTVTRANAFLRAAEKCRSLLPGALFSVRGVACPHHGRFAPADRLVLDQAVSLRFGPKSAPGAAMLVGTQTLEQSLDIDADLIVTDLAPADVLLQRIGRLWRHRRSRPPELMRAECLVLVPEGDLGIALGSDGKVAPTYRRVGYGSVYEDLRALELTRRLFLRQPDIRLPRDCRFLVESVTHPERLAELVGEKWEAHGQRVEGGDLARSVAADYATLPFDESFGEFEFTDVGEKVATRLGSGSLQLPLSRPFISPFGQRIEEIVIPRHLSPKQMVENGDVENQSGEGTVLTVGERRYLYGRFGLEAILS